MQTALERAPERVRLEGDTALSECLTRAGDPADVLMVGEVYIAAASKLADEEQALRVGYLLGAVRRGAGQTQGIHDELVRRLEQEAARLSDRTAVRRGERAGLESG